MGGWVSGEGGWVSGWVGEWAGSVGGLGGRGKGYQDAVGDDGDGAEGRDEGGGGPAVGEEVAHFPHLATEAESGGASRHAARE